MAFLLLAGSASTLAMADSNFVIEDGVLVKYTGAEEEVIIEEG